MLMMLMGRLVQDGYHRFPWSFGALRLLIDFAYKRTFMLTVVLHFAFGHYSCQDEFWSSAR